MTFSSAAEINKASEAIIAKMRAATERLRLEKKARPECAYCKSPILEDASCACFTAVDE